MAGFIRLGF